MVQGCKFYKSIDKPLLTYFLVIERLIYPALLAGLAMYGNLHILGKQIGEQIRAVDIKVDKVNAKVDMKVEAARKDLALLGDRQFGMEQTKMAFAERVFRSCADSKKR